MGAQYLAKFGAVPLFDAVEERAIATFENTLGVHLPEDYRQFLHEWNGVDFTNPSDPNCVVAFAAQPIDCHLPRAIPQDHWPAQPWEREFSVMELTQLYGIASAEYLMSLSKSDPGFGFEVWAPPRFLAIGLSHSGIGHVCVSLSDFDRGEIYAWRWPDESLAGEIVPNMRCMWWVASTFREFWDVLTLMDDDERIDNWT